MNKLQKQFIEENKREIKFRAWSFNEKKMYYNVYITSDQWVVAEIEPESDSMGMKEKALGDSGVDCIVMEKTHYENECGKSIWEGDIINNGIIVCGHEHDESMSIGVYKVWGNVFECTTEALDKAQEYEDERNKRRRSSESTVIFCESNIDDSGTVFEGSQVCNSHIGSHTTNFEGGASGGGGWGI